MQNALGEHCWDQVACLLLVFFLPDFVFRVMLMLLEADTAACRP